MSADEDYNYGETVAVNPNSVAMDFGRTKEMLPTGTIGSDFAAERANINAGCGRMPKLRTDDPNFPEKWLARVDDCIDQLKASEIALVRSSAKADGNKARSHMMKMVNAGREFFNNV